MQHIDGILPHPHASAEGYDASFFLREIPEIGESSVDEETILRHGALLYEYLRQKRICEQCKGFERCGKAGDMRGFEQVLEITPRGLATRVRRCMPFREYVVKDRVRRYAQLAGVTEIGDEFRFENFPDEQAQKYPKVFRYAQEFARNWGPQEAPRAGLYLFGPPGVGKTHLMFAVFRELQLRGVPSLVVRSDSLFDHMRHVIAAGEDLEPFLETLSTVPVLGIDEFAQERANEFSMEKLFRIVNYRFHHKLSTWFTSNFSPPDAYRRGGDDLLDTVAPLRSRVMSMCILVKMDGPDARQRRLRTLV
ncbi:ATP-binding protein [Alicyclobacillus mali]|uniref:ATP-binding protein n=1 Tax=Alicyclobacillus mali (ex Roth et al. 2021) TaxID=1123961 RepID=A0ABS0F613_9BACL|nr:AFG1/ZapE family ATPase [Alicyclobacillus mali (ex Roth et al. 2021)]MBF8378729.1 ATP-binding protein [Alicyclobacillus mali (ex Roth et al. 2021)]MCL6487714.1 cell division protein ZapE [Alicyclobacillus mali (ex Roth et al. 2021)]